ncbi:MAG: response regulator [Bacteroidales bacterium]
MRILNCIKKILHSNNATKLLTQELELYKTLVGSTHHSMLILDKNRYITRILNTKDDKQFAQLVNAAIGKPLSYFVNDSTSPFNQACTMFNKVFDKVLSTGKTEELSYIVGDSYLKAEISKINNEQLLVQIHDITAIVKETKELEQKNYKELSMALTAGGITSWSYDVNTRIISSSHKNNIIGDSVHIDDVISRALPKYKEEITTMFNDIANNKTQHCNIIIKIKNLNGDVQLTDIHAIPYSFTPDGRVSVIMGSQKDITAEYENKQKLDNLNKQNELILNNIKSGLVYIAPNYKVIWENVTKVFHHPSQANYYRQGTYCYEAFSRSTPCEKCVMKEAMLTHKPASNEFTNEAGISVEALANPLLGENDDVEGVIIRLDDITQKKKTSKQLKETQQKVSAVNQLLSIIVENLPSSFFVKDANSGYKYIMANKKYCHNLGLAEKDIIGKTDYDLFPKEEADKYRSNDINTLELNQTKVFDGEYVTVKNGIAIWYTIKTPLININDNNKKLVIGIGVDITESHKAYEELAIAKKKAEESDKLKSSFLANMSHEIRTPLNAIVGFSELMQSCTNEEEKEEYMQIISTNSELLLRLINDILDLSKLESGIVQLNYVRFNLVNYFYELSATMKRLITNPSIKFIAINPYESCIIEADKIRMTQVWQNFMTNAIKYTVSGYIKMGYEYVNNGIKIYVEDTGIGIADEKKSKLFSRFEKLDSFAQGTGLGLSICKAITELAGGHVGFESTKNKGSLFWSWIPLDAEITLKTNDENISFSTEQKIDTIIDREKYLKKHRCKILIAEDNDSNYQLLNHMLKNDFQLFRTTNGVETVDFVKNDIVDLILMDIRMPIMDGLEATLEIRKFNKDVQIIAVTANAFESDHDAALECGCNDFISKPVSKADLINAMFKMCKRKMER